MRANWPDWKRKASWSTWRTWRSPGWKCSPPGRKSTDLMLEFSFFLFLFLFAVIFTLQDGLCFCPLSTAGTHNGVVEISSGPLHVMEWSKYHPAHYKFRSGRNIIRPVSPSHKYILFCHFDGWSDYTESLRRRVGQHSVPVVNFTDRSIVIIFCCVCVVLSTDLDAGIQLSTGVF